MKGIVWESVQVMVLSSQWYTADMMKRNSKALAHKAGATRIASDESGSPQSLTCRSILRRYREPGVVQRLRAIPRHCILGSVLRARTMGAYYFHGREPCEPRGGCGEYSRAALSASSD